MIEETQEDRDRHQAEERGRFNEKLEQHFREDDRRFASIGVDVTETKREVKTIKDEMRGLGAKIERREAVAEALAKSAKELAEKQVTAKQLYFTALGLVLALGGLLAGSGAFG